MTKENRPSEDFFNSITEGDYEALLKWAKNEEKEWKNFARLIELKMKKPTPPPSKDGEPN